MAVTKSVIQWWWHRLISLRDAARLVDGGCEHGEARGEGLSSACVFVGANAATFPINKTSSAIPNS